MHLVDPRQLSLAFPMCSRCSTQPIRESHRYCLDCFAGYMREWRKTHPLDAEQRFKDNARSYAGTYKRRNKLIPQPCAHCGEEAEMHHPDYAQPLKVEWLCRPCHLALHKTLAANIPYVAPTLAGSVHA
jgi:hypothetical protein